MNEQITLGQLMNKIVSSDRVVVINAARQVVYRGFAANFTHTRMNDLRKVKSFGLGMETYKKIDKMWDWQKINELPEQIPIEQISKYDTGELQHIIYTKIILED